jgi:TetR/AcrR family transcriptional regulator, lmrAB and yxaGH operons repressor
MNMTSAAVFTATDTRSRILQAAYRTLRKRGYHASGLADILALAQAPKGSMYHHFPGGKEEMGVAVIEIIANDILAIFSGPPELSTAALLQVAGQELLAVTQRTQFEICAMFSSFVAESHSSPQLAQAVAQAYGRMLEALQQRLMADGLARAAAADLAKIVIALLEGGSMLSQAQRDVSALRLSIAQAARLCPQPQVSPAHVARPRTSLPRTPEPSASQPRVRAR